MSPALFDAPPELTLADVGVRGGSESAVVVDCEQNTAAWFALRCGIPTASGFDNIVTPTGEPRKGKTPQSYMNGLLAERLMGRVEMNMKDTPAMERGRNLEPQARADYAFEQGRAVREVGFVYEGAGHRWGGSPDGLCEDRGIEIKCPMHRNMIGTLRAGVVPPEYVMQVHGLMWICGLDVWDFVLWTPEAEIPNAVWTVERDDKLRAALAEHVPAFCEEMAQAETKLREMDGD